jgi:hypothetical protein
MLEEKNDNLQHADGEELDPITGSVPQDYSPETETESNADARDEASITEIHETEGQLPFAPEVVINGGREVEAARSTSDEANDVSSEAEVEVAPAETASEFSPSEDSTSTESNEESSASDEEAHEEEHTEEVPDYGAHSMEELTAELEKLVVTENVMSVKNHVEELRREFYAKYNHLIEEKKDEFSNENNGDTTGFEYNFPLKHKFDSVYNQYRDKKSTHFKKMQTDLKGNFDKRLAIVEELKNLADGGENMKDALKQVNELRERWKNAGPIPRDKYNHVFNNFHFHIERFYDHLHLDREARDLDFKHNLEQKQKIVARVEELVNEPDVNKAFRELQALHKMWKEEIGPVSRDHREEIWNRFSELTKQIHDKREAIFAKSREAEQENLENKQDIIARINAIASEKIAVHGAWQGQIDRIESLRDQFFKAGKVPIEVNEDTWAAFKAAVRNFNTVKNSFYKDIKKDQQTNLNRKLELVEKANALKDNEDFEATTPVMKQIQDEWKTIGHVPRKYSDSVWKDFKGACNHYFDRLHAKRNEANGDEIEAFDKKKEYLDSLKDFELTGDHRTDLDAIKKHIENWKSYGRVPQARRHIEGKFNKILDALFDKLSLSKKETDMVKFSNRLEQLSEGDDSRGLQNEQLFISRKIDEIQAEIFQLENNIQFFSNAKGNNPFVNEVNKNIERHKEELKTWKDKLKQIKNVNKPQE